MSKIISNNIVIDFIASQGAAGASSKAIAKHFGVNSKLVNTAYSEATDHVDRFERSWPGIYKVTGIVTRDHVHYVAVAVARSESESESESESALLTPPPSPVMPSVSSASIITENNIIDFITSQGASGASSKAIAKHFGVNSKLVNTAYSEATDHVDRFERSWPGIYKVTGIVTRDHVHYPADAKVKVADVKVKVADVKAEEPTVAEPVEDVKAEEPTVAEVAEIVNAAPLPVLDLEEVVKDAEAVEVNRSVNVNIDFDFEFKFNNKFNKIDALFYVLMLVMFVAHIIYKVDYPDLHRIAFLNAERQLALYLPSVSALSFF